MPQPVNGRRPLDLWVEGPSTPGHTCAVSGVVTVGEVVLEDDAHLAGEGGVAAGAVGAVAGAAGAAGVRVAGLAGAGVDLVGAGGAVGVNGPDPGLGGGAGGQRVSLVVGLAGGQATGAQ